MRSTDDRIARLEARVAKLEAAPASGDELMGLPDDTRLYTPDLAGILGCSPRSIQRRVKAGKLPEPAWEGGKRVWLAGAVKERYRELQQESALRNHRKPGWRMN